MKDLRKDGVRRRRFLKAMPAAVAGGLALPALAQQAQEQTQRIGKDTLECGEKIFGVDFSDAEETQAIGGVNRNLDAFEQLRAIDVPLDTEPAVLSTAWPEADQDLSAIFARAHDRGAKVMHMVDCQL